jgi:chromosome segregation ATPase
MSAQVLFNQFAYADRLKRGGFSDDQARASAEALGDALTETVATKSDLERTESALKADLERTESTIKTDLERTKSALKADIERVDAKIDVVRAELKTEIAATKNDLIRWILMLNIATAGLLFTAIKLFK